MNQKDELDLLLLDSLKQFSEEFEARQKQITEQHLICLNAFTEQSEALLIRQQNTVMRRRR